MPNFIKSCFFALLLAPALAGAQNLPVFSIDGGAQTPLPQVPAVPPPFISSGPAGIPPPALAIPDYAFSGQSDIAALLESAIRGCRTSVDVAVYGLTLPGVAKALVDAKARGVAVRVLVNDAHLFASRTSEELELLVERGVNVRSLRGVGRNGIMHNKLGIYDGRLVSAGSFNWAVTANTDNSENAVFLRDAAAVAGYKKYFDWMWGYARPAADGPGAPVKKFGSPPEDSMRGVFYNGVLLPAYSFSPGGRTEADILNALNFTRDSADIAVFSFYSMEIAQAVVNAHKRGAKVRVLVDRVQASQSEVGELLLKNGVPFRWSQGFGGKGVMHNKYAVLDSRLLLTGSFNWSVNAQDNNFENTFYTMAPSYVKGFAAQFERLFALGETPSLTGLQQEPARYR